MLPVVKVVTLAPTLAVPAMTLKLLKALHWIVYPVSPTIFVQVTVTRSALAPCRTGSSSKDGWCWREWRYGYRGCIGVCRLYDGIYRCHPVGVGNSRLNRREFIPIRDVACAIAGSQRDEQGEVYAIRRPFHDKAELVVGIITEGQVDSRPDSQNRSQVGWSGRCIRCSNQNRVRVQGWPDGIHGIHTVNIIPVGYAG